MWSAAELTLSPLRRLYWAHSLLLEGDSHDEEVRVLLRHVQARFGEEVLSDCDVMLHDTRESTWIGASISKTLHSDAGRSSLLAVADCV